MWFTVFLSFLEGRPRPDVEAEVLSVLIKADSGGTQRQPVASQRRCAPDLRRPFFAGWPSRATRGRSYGHFPLPSENLLLILVLSFATKGFRTSGSANPPLVPLRSPFVPRHSPHPQYRAGHASGKGLPRRPSLYGSGFFLKPASGQLPSYQHAGPLILIANPPPPPLEPPSAVAGRRPFPFSGMSTQFSQF